MPAAAPAYLISRSLDPVFAIFIGLSAAAMRVRREETEQGRSSAETIEALKRRLGLSSSSSSTK